VSLLRRITGWFRGTDPAPTDDCCRRGHPFTEDNTYMRPDGRGRECRACRNNRRRIHSTTPADAGHESKEG